MKTSELIKRLEDVISNYGDLEITLHTDHMHGRQVTRYDDVYIGIDEYEYEPPKLDIRSFPYCGGRRMKPDRFIGRCDYCGETAECRRYRTEFNSLGKACFDCIPEKERKE